MRIAEPSKREGIDAGGAICRAACAKKLIHRMAAGKHI